MKALKILALQIVLVAGFLTFTLPARAEVSVTAELDKSEGTLEDVYYLTVNIDGKSADAPQLPHVDGLEVQSGGKSEQIQMINGSISRHTSYRYALSPRRAGVYTIPPITVVAGKETRSTEPLTLRVGQAPAADPQAPKDVYLTAELSKSRAYVGEQVLYTLRFFRRINTSSAELGKPDFKDFVSEPLGEPKTSERIISGQRFQVSEIRFALFAARAGDLEIEPASVRFESILTEGNDPFTRFGFFNSGRRIQSRVASPSLKLHVQPLPTEGRPADFSGLIGSFKLETAISTRNLAVGDSTTLTVRVVGEGNVRQMPDVPVSGDNVFTHTFKIYDDKPVLKVEPTTSGLRGEKIFKKALVPLSAGDLTIPAVHLSFFDTAAGHYATLRGEAYTLTVTPAARGNTLVVGGQELSPQKRKVEMLAEDLMPLATKFNDVRDERMAMGERGALAAVTAIPPTIFLALFFMRKNRDRRDKNTAAIVSQKALKKARKALAHVEKLADKKPREFFSELGRVLRGYVGDKLALQGLAMTPSEAAAEVLRHGANSETAKLLKEILDTCERMQFSGAESAAKSPKKWLVDAQDLMRDLDKIL